MITITAFLAQLVSQDLWFTFMLSILYMLIIGYVFYILASVFPNKNIFEISTVLCGKVIGGILNVLLIYFILFIFIRDLLSITIFINTSLLPHTPVEILVLLQVGVFLYFGRHTLQTSLFLNDIFFAVTFIGSIVALPFLILDQFSFANLQPILELSMTDLGKSNIVNLGIFGDLIILGAFLNHMKAPQVLKAVRVSAFFIPLYAILWSVLLIGVFNPSTIKKLTYPFYNLVQMTKAGELLDRLDIFFFGIWFPIFLLEYIFMYLALHVSVKHMAKNQHTTVLNRPLSLLVGLIILLTFVSYQQVFSLAAYISFVHVIVIQSIFVFCWLLFLLLKKRSLLTQSLKKLNRAKDRRVHWIVGGLYVAALLFIIGGMIGGKYHYMIANLCGLLYFISLLAAYVVSLFNRKKENG